METMITGAALLLAGFAAGWLLARRVDKKHVESLWRVKEGLPPTVRRAIGHGKPEVSK